MPPASRQPKPAYDIIAYRGVSVHLLFSLYCLSASLVNWDLDDTVI